MFRTKGNSMPHGKPRVYFTCYPDDFDCYFDKICNDIFDCVDCTIYYKSDINDWMTDEEKSIDLHRMNLVVIPVSMNLLTKRNPAMDDEFKYALSQYLSLIHI